MTSLMRHSIITALAVCLVASFTACGNKQTKDAKAIDSTAIQDTIVSEKVEPQVDSTKIFSDTVAQRGKMVYKVTRQVKTTSYMMTKETWIRVLPQNLCASPSRTMAKSASKKHCKTTLLGVENGKRMAMT